MKLFIVFVFVIAVTGVYSAADTCKVPGRKHRVNCGWQTQTDCEANNCCWILTDKQAKTYSCIHPKDKCNHKFQNPCKPGALCKNKGNAQFECICNDGSTDEECRGLDGAIRSIEPDDRVGCGRVDDQPVPEEACLGRSCVYNNATEGVKWCFPPIIPECETRSDKRVRCADTKEQCDKFSCRGCCWDENEKVQCAHPRNPCNNEYACTDGATCVNLGNAQWDCICPLGVTCCRGMGDGSCAVDPDDRVPCGRVDTESNPALACQRRGCCYDNSIEGVRWCYHRRKCCVS